MRVRFLLAFTMSALSVLSVSPPAASFELTKYGTRPLITCPEAAMKVRGNGPPAMEAVRVFVTCTRETDDGRQIILVKSISVEIGSGRSYNPNTDLMTDHAEGTPVYPIRGELTMTLCSVPITVSIGYLQPTVGKNCSEADEHKAYGQCHVTGFGTWSCYMSGDLGARRQDVPPLTE